MEEEMKNALDWAIKQTYREENGEIKKVSKDNPHVLVAKVREYFNENNINYETFGFDDLPSY